MHRIRMDIHRTVHNPGIVWTTSPRVIWKREVAFSHSDPPLPVSAPIFRSPR